MKEKLNFETEKYLLLNFLLSFLSNQEHTKEFLYQGFLAIIQLVLEEYTEQQIKAKILNCEF